MSDDYVWVTKMTHNSMGATNIKSSLPPQEYGDARYESVKLYKKGKTIPPEHSPKKLWLEDFGGGSPVYSADTLPDQFKYGDFWIVSERAANIIRQFDLGGGALYPVSEGVFEQDQVTRFPGDYFCWIFGNVKTGFLAAETPNKREFAPGATHIWSMPWKLADNDIAVSQVVKTGPDVWLDLALFQSVFVSRALGDALDAAGLREVFGLSKARMI